MTELIKVEGYASLRRDLSSGAIVNTNLEQFEAAQRRQNALIQKDEKMKMLEEKLAKMEQIIFALSEKVT